MKKNLYILLIAAVAGCTSKDAVKPELDRTAGLTGKYTITSVTYNEVMSAQQSGHFEITKIDATRVYVKSISFDQGKEKTWYIGDRELTNMDLATYDLMDGKTKHGTISPKELLISGTTTQGLRYVYKASR